MTCGTPLAPEALLDYWTGDLIGASARVVEEHVFACPSCAERLSALEALADGVRKLAAAGTLRGVVPPALVERLVAAGLRVRTYVLRAGATVPCGAAADDDLLVARIPVDLGGVERVDLLLCDEAWNERERHADVPVDRRAGEVVMAERVDVARSGAPYVLRLRLVAVAEGAERALGAYALDHDPRGPPG